LQDDITFQNFLDLQKEKGKKKPQEVTTQAKENNKIISKSSAKRYSPLFCGRNVPNLTPKIINYLHEMSNKISILDEEPEEMLNEEENSATN